MIRRCDGTDPTLVRAVEHDVRERAAGDCWTAGNAWTRCHCYQPCACGRVFDDVDRMVIWPHLPV